MHAYSREVGIYCAPLILSCLLFSSHRYQSTQFAFSCRNQQIFPPVQLYELGAMDVDQMVRHTGSSGLIISNQLTYI